MRQKQNGVDDNNNKNATDNILVVARVAAATDVEQDRFVLYTTGIDNKDGIVIDIESASLSLRPVP